MHRFSGRIPMLLRRQPSTPRPAVPIALPLHIPIDEEKTPGYKRENFLHPNPGDLLDGRYSLKAKIGWGSSSTVWLAEKGRGWFGRQKYFAIKIGTNGYSEGEAMKELAMSKHLASGDNEHRGHSLLVTALDHFTVESRNGPHICLVFEPMRDPLWLYRRRLAAGKITATILPLIKVYIRAMLYALDYLHSDRHVIHTGNSPFLTSSVALHTSSDLDGTDLKLDNILMSFEHTSVIDCFVQCQLANPMPRKVIGDDIVYLCHNDFGDFQQEHLKYMVPKIADFGLAQRGDGAEPLLHPIQPNHCHAPEVMLGTGWSYSADIWNFGIMLWDLLAGRELFLGRQTDKQDYSAAQHLAEMVALLGPVPEALLQRQRDMAHWRWAPAALNPKGILCNNAADYFGGPFFDNDGKFMHDSLIPFHRQLGKELPDCILLEDADRFLRFIKRMLCWLPEDRATAKALVQDPWHLS
ncbi:Serine/threonine-protein kinase SRPK [Tolypocladium ophioglossoides CBS 100239]|uniref:non-specific serine/threonine protein kinase n=1 Tax=Tolypocladium ophioglossoides (strain CBS 100239) TaxID=1163406 RepID=A0A0L0N1U4_TOLOC|nr:Serine/threonine-protein kinase SRPK [Tolypocladium ophioglossoides CBS 100239]